MTTTFRRSSASRCCCWLTSRSDCSLICWLDRLEFGDLAVQVVWSWRRRSAVCAGAVAHAAPCGSSAAAACRESPEAGCSARTVRRRSGRSPRPTSGAWKRSARRKAVAASRLPATAATIGPGDALHEAVEIAVLQRAPRRRPRPDRSISAMASSLIQRKSCRCGSCSRLPVLNWMLDWPVSGLTVAADRLSQELRAVGQA